MQDDRATIVESPTITREQAAVLYETAQELQVDLERKNAECFRLGKKVEELTIALEQKQARIHWLEGKVEAFEYCVKNGRAK